MTPETVQIDDQYITLAQFLKYINIIGSGGEAKLFLADIEVLYNGEIEQRRGKKLYDGDVIDIPALDLSFVIDADGAAE
ncbi:S4 domain-containing protein YaaA [Dolosigranulum pigrum]|uniref:S4 domain-containing protein YaaA n=1 Tax=Dolosigranulum pigrum TaxID=29394 RepID=UPI001AD85F50|nr:S4 domain-containing protein YaaA [Dolosigranulum pigrum]QTJ33807.1 S4 domain-containing protein YaaA [Dolosigranulum pigrum]QTJ38987.1 S4 domain-containing protein YaaA [Dolosigranulum pigrum]QTJ47476.1 S4 domain-containing protein YaaA [Dolosigranulum pigrum]